TILLGVLFVATLALAQDKRCLSNYGQTVCGYDCTANYGQVKCARTPAGACMAQYGKVVCWDPAYYGRYAPPKAQCLANYGQIACGYSCVANYGMVRCAQTPNG